MHMVAARLGFEKAMVGTRWVTGRVLCTWWLLGLALKRPWLVPGGSPVGCCAHGGC